MMIPVSRFGSKCYSRLHFASTQIDRAVTLHRLMNYDEAQQMSSFCLSLLKWNASEIAGSATRLAFPNSELETKGLGACFD